MTENPRPLRVFLCHAHGDKPAVRELYKKLSASGYQPWLDEEDLLPGQDWEREISIAVKTSDAVLVCLSRASITKRGFVQKEIKYALDVADQQPEGVIFVIPARLEDCEVPDRISRWHWVNLFEDRGYEKLLRSLEVRARALQPKLEKGAREGSAALEQSLSGPTIPAVSDAAEIVPGEPTRTPEAARGETFGFETVTLDETGKVTSRRHAEAHQFVEELAPGVNLEMVAIPGETFTMGSPPEEESSRDNERPQHEVTVSPFHMSKYAVTQSQWRVVAGWTSVERDLASAPSHFKGDGLPVEQTSWEDAVEFCARLSNRTGRPYRLPTEAEWEYACRAETSTPFAFGQTISPEFVNYNSMLLGFR